MSNKYLEKIAMSDVSTDTKNEIAQTGVVAGAGAIGTHLTDRIGQKLGLVSAPVKQAVSAAPKTFGEKLLAKATGRGGQLMALGAGIGTALDYGAVKLNNALNKQAQINVDKKNKGLLHKKLGVSKGKKISNLALKQAKSQAKRSGNTKLEKEVVFAQNAKKWNHKK